MAHSTVVMMAARWAAWMAFLKAEMMVAHLVVLKEHCLVVY